MLTRLQTVCVTAGGHQFPFMRTPNRELPVLLQRHRMIVSGHMIDTLDTTIIFSRLPSKTTNFTQLQGGNMKRSNYTN